MIDRCECCNGRKKLLQLGAIYGDCKHCKGIGYITSEPAANLENFSNAEINQADILSDDFLTAKKLPAGDIIVTKKNETLNRKSGK